MPEDLFSASTPLQRITALLDVGSLTGDLEPAHGSLIGANGTIVGRQVTVIATDRNIAGGSLGVVEAEALSTLLEQSHAVGRPCILCLDSAGARLDEGLHALGAFRQLYRHVLDLRLAGLPLLGLIGRDCFGGASMLAATCAKRVYCESSRLAMSGPAVIQALSGVVELDATDADAVTALMGGAARAQLLQSDQLCEDSLDAFGAAAREWVGACDGDAQLDLHHQHTRLGTRLLAHGMAPSRPQSASGALPTLLQEIIPEGVEVHRMDGVLVARTGKTSPNAFFGFIDGAPVGALAAWMLAGECLALADERRGEAVTIFLDSPGQAPTCRDERVMLSEYVAHLALVLSSLRRIGHRLTLQVLGAAAGGIYVALAAPAVRVVALPGAHVQVLPPAAMARVLRRHNEPGGVEDYMRSGVIDTLI
ncbi:MAG: biotin-independent malonate decarboxylase subunit gamma [Betaproteobacteria bacterium]